MLLFEVGDKLSVSYGNEHLVAYGEDSIAELFALQKDNRYWPGGPAIKVLVVDLEPSNALGELWFWRFACTAGACLFWL